MGETLVSDESGSRRYEIDSNQAFGKKLYYSANFVLDENFCLIVAIISPYVSFILSF